MNIPASNAYRQVEFFRFLEQTLLQNLTKYDSINIQRAANLPKTRNICQKYKHTQKYKQI